MAGSSRGRSNDRRRRPQNEKRKPPEEATGQERRYLHGQLKSGGRLRVEMIDGTSSLGVVRSFNEDTILMDSEERSGVVLRKSQIRTISELD